uniref:RNA-directed RNA polymerase n=1 Tax=Red clover umbravirus TaxID=2301725 RepID=A0A3Q8H9L0_9TOMB|nr:putative replicase [Red clover umbravirus]
MSIDRIKRWFTPDFTPGEGVLSRDALTKRVADPTWALLVCQERARRDFQAITDEWYEGTMECNLLIPSPTPEAVLGPAQPKAKPDDEVVSDEGLDSLEKESVSDSHECAGTVASSVVEEFLSADTEQLSDPPATAAELAMEEHLHRVRMAELNSCRAIVPWVATGLPREEDVLPRARGVIIVSEVPASAITLSVKVWEAVRLAQGVLSSIVKRGSRAATAADFTAQVLPVATVSGCDYPSQETGAAAKWITPGCIAMEMRARFGVPKRTPANLEMGGRVARELLRDNCVTCRETTWYMSAMAVDLWLTPTVVDLACGRRPVDFLVGAVLPRLGEDTSVKFQNLHPSIEVIQAAKPRPTQRISYQIDVVRPLGDFGVHNNSLVNLARGINERVFYTDNARNEPLTPSVPFPSIEGLKSFRVHPWTMEQVVESYTGSQKTRYQNALDSILSCPLNPRDARVKTFVKAEKINFTAKPDPAPRVIQPRDPRFNIMFAKYIKPLEPLLYKALGRLYKYPAVAKGFNAVETGEIIAKKWQLFKDPVVVGLDASRFDQHVSVEALKFTHAIYRRYVKSREFNNLLQMMYTNRGLGSAKDGFIRYKVKGRRMSGDMDTALGNCVLMVLLTRNLCNSLHIPHELFDNGDDCIVFFDKCHLEKFNSAVKPYFADLGFKMKVEAPVEVLEKIEFCQTQPIYDGEKWRTVRSISSISKDCASVIDWDQLEGWWDAIAQSGLAVCGGIPIYTSFYRWLARAGKSGTKCQAHPLWKNEGLNWYRMGMDLSQEVTVSAQSRLSFHSGFGIPPAMQVALENLYDSLPPPSVHLGPPVKSVQQRLFTNYFFPEEVSSSLSMSTDSIKPYDELGPSPTAALLCAQC